MSNNRTRENSPGDFNELEAQTSMGEAPLRQKRRPSLVPHATERQPVAPLGIDCGNDERENEGGGHDSRGSHSDGGSSIIHMWNNRTRENSLGDLNELEAQTSMGEGPLRRKRRPFLVPHGTERQPFVPLGIDCGNDERENKGGGFGSRGFGSGEGSSIIHMSNNKTRENSPGDLNELEAPGPFRLKRKDNSIKLCKED